MSNPPKTIRMLPSDYVFICDLEKKTGLNFNRLCRTFVYLMRDKNTENLQDFGYLISQLNDDESVKRLGMYVQTIPDELTKYNPKEQIRDAQRRYIMGNLRNKRTIYRKSMPH
ncbi:MAG: hypothetical protein KC483_11310 [Nitrosarchaeum sp.]|nr:hypothetical protein [Nitrosarchaeum sp.]